MISKRSQQGFAAGFTLVEMLVAVSVFSMVMLIATGSVFAIVESNKKAHAIKSVMTNLNFALESMSRDIRVGMTYRCSNDPGDDLAAPADCSSDPGTVFSYRANRDLDGDGLVNSADRIQYWMSGGRIMKQSGPDAPLAVTATEITVESLEFYVIGAPLDDDRQPKVVMTVQGYAGVGQTRSDFNIKTTISQRAFDS